MPEEAGKPTQAEARPRRNRAAAPAPSPAPAPDVEPLSWIAPDLRPLARPISELVEDPENARAHPEENLAAIRKSLVRFGQRKPIVVRAETGVVVAGNGTLAVARELGWSHVAASVQSMTEAEARAYAIADNRTAELAEWRPERLAASLEALGDFMPPEDLGFTAADLREILPEPEAPAPPEEDPQPWNPPKDPVSRRGEIYQLGPHRLLCGDSTDEADVARLMGGEKAVLLATDPPYLVDYKGGNHPQSWHNKPDVKDKHWDDYTDPESGVEFYERFLKVALAHCAPGVAVYQWHAYKRQALVEEAWTRAGLLVHQQIIWVKARPVLTRSHFMWQHEPCFYGWVQGTPPTRRPPSNETTVWSVDQKGNQDGIHPTQKPLELFLRPIRWHTAPGELCLEPFAGSGTCLIAAAMAGRRCYAVELSPAFCDAIRKRWGDYARANGMDPGPDAL